MQLKFSIHLVAWSLWYEYWILFVKGAVHPKMKIIIVIIVLN